MSAQHSPPAGWRIVKQDDQGQDTEARLLLAHDDDEQRLLIIWPADDDPSIFMVHACGTCAWEGPCSHGIDEERQAALRTLVAMAGTPVDATDGRVQVPMAVVAALAFASSPAERDIVMDAIAVLVGGHWQELR